MFDSRSVCSALAFTLAVIYYLAQSAAATITITTTAADVIVGATVVALLCVCMRQIYSKFSIKCFNFCAATRGTHTYILHTQSYKDAHCMFASCGPNTSVKNGICANRWYCVPFSNFSTFAYTSIKFTTKRTVEQGKVYIIIVNITDSVD